MEQFDFKKWLFENKQGAYSKASLNEDIMDPAAFDDGVENRGDMDEITQAAADRQMQKQDDLNSDMVNNVSMGVVAEGSKGEMDVNIEEWPVTILGQTYLIDAKVDVEYHYESSDYEDHRMISQGGYQIDSAWATITRLSVKEGDDYRDINDKRSIKQIEDLINMDPKYNRALEKEAGDTIDWSSTADPDDIDTYSPEDLEETVGYAMITKPAVEEVYTGSIPDTESIESYVKDIALSNFSVEDIPETSIRDLISNLQTKFQEGNIKTYEELEAEIERMVRGEEIKSSLTPGPNGKFVGEPTSDLFKMYTKF